MSHVRNRLDGIALGAAVLLLAASNTAAGSAQGFVTTTITYDPLGRVSTHTVPDGTIERFGYDEVGNLTSIVDGNGTATSISYDEMDREILRTFPPPAVPTGHDLVSIATTLYDPNGNPLEIVERYSDGSSRTTTKTYDSFDRVLTVTNPDGKTLSHTYDPAGNRTRLKDHDGKTTLFGFDDLNRLSTVTVPGIGVTGYQYYRDDLLKSITYPNGTDVRYSYDNSGRIDTITSTKALADGGARDLVVAFDYDYDTNGNRCAELAWHGPSSGPSPGPNGYTPEPADNHCGENAGAAPEAGERTLYAFDAVDRLVRVEYPDKTVTLTYDQAGNRLTERVEIHDGQEPPALVADRSFNYDSRDRLLSVADAANASNNATYSYDANGNQTSRRQGNVITGFLYDQRNQLVEVQVDADGPGGADPQMVERYQFDYAGLRVKRAGSGSVSRYLYDGRAVLAQTDDAGITVTRYSYGPGRLQAIESVSEGTRFYVADGLGSPVALLDPSGNAATRYVWDPWGMPRRQEGESANAFGFTGHEYDPITGLYYARARFYDPAIGRFLTKDPFDGVPEIPASLHAYLYAHGNPLYYVDPTGQCVLGLPCPAVVQDQIDIHVATAEALVTSVAQVGGGIVVGTAATAVRVSDIGTFGALPRLGAALGAFVGDGGSLTSRSAAAELAKAERLADQVASVNSLARQLADPGALADRFVDEQLGGARMAAGAEILSDGLAFGDAETLARGAAEMLGGASEGVLTLADRGAQFKRQLDRPHVARATNAPDPPPSQVKPQAKVIGENPYAPGAMVADVEGVQSAAALTAHPYRPLTPHPSDPNVNGGHRGRYYAALPGSGRPPLPDTWDVHHTTPQRLGRPFHPQHELAATIDIHEPSRLRGLMGQNFEQTVEVTEPSGRKRLTNPHAQIDHELTEFLRTNPTRDQLDAFTALQDWRWLHTYWEAGYGQ